MEALNFSLLICFHCQLLTPLPPTLLSWSNSPTWLLSQSRSGQ